MCEPEFTASALHVVRIGTAQQEHTDEDAAAADEGEAQQDVGEGGGPEGEQVQRLVAVRIRDRRVLVVVGHVNGVDPHVTWRNPDSLTVPKDPQPSNLKLPPVVLGVNLTPIRKTGV